MSVREGDGEYCLSYPLSLVSLRQMLVQIVDFYQHGCIVYDSSNIQFRCGVMVYGLGSYTGEHEGPGFAPRECQTHFFKTRHGNHKMEETYQESVCGNC